MCFAITRLAVNTAMRQSAIPELENLIAWTHVEAVEVLM